MISLGKTKINFQYDNHEGFAQLLAAVKPYVTKKDDERQTQSSTPGGTDSNQLAFQVYLFKNYLYVWRLIYLSQSLLLHSHC